MRAKKIKALNSLEVTEWSASSGELEYVVVENSRENRKILLEAGFTKEQLSEATDGLDEEIDLVTLAVNYANIYCWIKGRGFVEEDVYNEWERQKNKDTEQIL